MQSDGLHAEANKLAPALRNASASFGAWQSEQTKIRSAVPKTLVYLSSMKTILTPVDFSPATRDVVNATVNLARPLGAHVLLLHSLQPPIVTTDYGIGIEVLHETLAVNEKVAIQQLEHLKAVLTAKGLVADTILVNGHAATHIIEQARDLKADYIILGSHGHTAFYDLLVGSTTHAVLVKSSCPVIVVPPAKKSKPAKKR